MKSTIFYLSLLWIVSGFIHAKETITDPTRPIIGAAPISSEKTKTIQNITLSAIFVKQGKRSAIISNNLYQVGDSFSGNKIVSIDDTSVLLQNSDGYRRLRLINKFKKLKK
jgi:hypothetical protein